jgi:hypothetical protein
MAAGRLGVPDPVYVTVTCTCSWVQWLLDAQRSRRGVHDRVLPISNTPYRGVFVGPPTPSQKRNPREPNALRFLGSGSTPKGAAPGEGEQRLGPCEGFRRTRKSESRMISCQVQEQMPWYTLMHEAKESCLSLS